MEWDSIIYGGWSVVLMTLLGAIIIFLAMEMSRKPDITYQPTQPKVVEEASPEGQRRTFKGLGG